MGIAQIHKLISIYSLFLPNNVMQSKALARLDHVLYLSRFVAGKKKTNKSCDAVFFLI